MLQKHSYKTPTYAWLARVAKPLYAQGGHNGWSHIQAVRRRAALMANKLFGRQLTPEQYAAALFHDSTKGTLGKKDHGRTAGQFVKKVLGEFYQKQPQKLQQVSKAISVHDDNLPKFDSVTAELLASADANPPDIGFILNKSYNYGLDKGWGRQGALQNVIQTTPAKYGSGGTFNYPQIYQDYYGDKLVHLKKILDSIDKAKAWRIIKRYRQKHGMPIDSASWQK